MSRLFRPEGLAILILLSLLVLGSLLIFTFGALSMAALFFLWLREPGLKRMNREELIGGVLLGVSAVWFTLNVLLELLRVQEYTGYPFLVVNLITLGIACLYPVFIMAVFYEERKAHLSADVLWKLPILLVLAVTVTVEIYLLAVILPGGPAAWNPAVVTVLPVLFSIAGLFSVAVILSSRPGKGSSAAEPPGLRRWMLGLLFFLILLVPLNFFRLDARPLVEFFEVAEVVFRSMPLFFVFVSTYYEGRFAFFDVFVKQGTFFFVTLVLLSGYFTLAVPWLETARVPGLVPYVFAATLLPLALSLPWLYRRLEGWLDRAWLGRRFSPEEAVRFFLSGLEGATDEDELVRLAETRLSTIFQTGVRIRLGGPAEAEPSVPSSRCRIPISIHNRPVGVIEMGKRPNETPYFSQDVRLLSSLAGVFASVYESVRLQRRRRRQDRRERELRLHASRSELKALRAQINPHFLFNALNAIAGLIPRNPGLAEATVEQLADVFRYTLTRSDSEWVRLDEELAFVSAWLDVEKARFGKRLELRIESLPEVDSLRVPSMMVQTLVENALKHGVASVRGRALVGVRVRRTGERLRIEVFDNGPGFDAEASGGRARPERGRPQYGLRNIRRRLRGHFGRQARLAVNRNEEKGLTTVSIEMPLRDLPRSESVSAS